MPFFDKPCGEENILKVGVQLDGIMHLSDGKKSKTFCGLEWFFMNSHGELYCERCQYILARRRQKSRENKNA